MNPAEKGKESAGKSGEQLLIHLPNLGAGKDGHKELATTMLWVDKHRPNQLDKLDYHEVRAIDSRPVCAFFPASEPAAHFGTRHRMTPGRRFLLRACVILVQELTSQLRRVADKENVHKMSHLLFYGPSGAGKKTRVMALLREVHLCLRAARNSQ